MRYSEGSVPVPEKGSLLPLRLGIIAATILRRTLTFLEGNKIALLILESFSSTEVLTVEAVFESNSTLNYTFNAN